MIKNLIILKILLLLFVFLLSLIIVYIASQGLLGNRIQKYLSVSTKSELFVSVIIVTGLFMLTINLLLMLINYFLQINLQGINSINIIDGNVSAQDPVRYWPPGTAQTWSVIGSAAAIYKAVPGSNRTKIFAAFGSLAVTLAVARP